ncbi:MAG TPA: SH3 domain-containing protein [Bdellovibrionota bacterium]|jgi:hypothetical protein
MKSAILQFWAVMAVPFVLSITTVMAESHSAIPQKDQILEVRAAALALRDSTPDPSLGSKGTRIGWVKKGEVVKVLETKQYLTIFGTEIWAEVEKQDDASQHGWVLVGMAKEIMAGQSGLISPHVAAEEEAAKKALDEAGSDAPISRTPSDQD